MIDSLDKKWVKGKIVLCDEITDGEGILDAGAVDTIMQGVDFGDVTFSFPLPTSCLSMKDGSKVKNYYDSSRYFIKPLLWVTNESASHAIYQILLHTTMF